MVEFAPTLSAAASARLATARLEANHPPVREREVLPDGADLPERSGKHPSGDADINACADQAASPPDLQGHIDRDESGDERDDQKNGINPADEK